jgi:hypothetical protein
VPVRSLNSVRWRGEATYRALSYYFALRWNWQAAGAYIHRVFEGFAVPPDPSEHRSPPTPGIPPQYSFLLDDFRGKDRYRLFYGNDEIMESREAPSVLDRLFWHVNTEALLRTGDYLLVHSGAVVTPSGEGLLLPGASGSGKTSLAAGLIRAGFGCLSDEAGVIDPVTARLHPYPRAITLKAGSFSDFKALRPKRLPSFASRAQWHLQPDDIRPGALAKPTQVGFVIFPSYDGAKPTVLTQISPGETIVEMARNCLNLSRYRGRALLVFAEIVRAARCYRLAVGSVDEGVRAVMEITG